MGDHSHINNGTHRLPHIFTPYISPKPLFVPKSVTQSPIFFKLSRISEIFYSKTPNRLEFEKNVPKCPLFYGFCYLKTPCFLLWACRTKTLFSSPLSNLHLKVFTKLHNSVSKIQKLSAIDRVWGRNIPLKQTCACKAKYRGYFSDKNHKNRRAFGYLFLFHLPRTYFFNESEICVCDSLKLICRLLTFVLYVICHNLW